MAGYSEFQEFKNFQMCDKEKLDLVSNYVCLQLNNPSIGYKYYYDMYSYVTKCYIVLLNIKQQDLVKPIVMVNLLIF